MHQRSKMPFFHTTFPVKVYLENDRSRFLNTKTKQNSAKYAYSEAEGILNGSNCSQLIFSAMIFFMAARLCSKSSSEVSSSTASSACFKGAAARWVS